MPTYDFECPACEHQVLDDICSIATAEAGVACPKCSVFMTRLMNAPRMFTTIIPMYPGSKRFKAGYIHQFANRPAEKTQIGPGGSVSKPD